MGTKRFVFPGRLANPPNYWVVAGVMMTRNPFRHPSEDAAAQEAIRLARLHPDQIFTVYGAQLKFRYCSETPVAKLDPMNSDEDPYELPKSLAKLTDAEIIKAQQKLIGDLKVALGRVRSHNRSQQISIEKLKTEAIKQLDQAIAR